MENTTNSTVTIEKLKEENEILQQQKALLQNEKAELEIKLNWYEEQYRLSQHRLFGSLLRCNLFSKKHLPFSGILGRIPF